MKVRMFVLTCLALLTFYCSTSFSQSQALWVTIKQKGELTTEIVMPLNLVKTVLEASQDTAKLGIAGAKLSVQTLKKALEQSGGELLSVYDHKADIETQLSVKEFKQAPKSIKGGSSLVIEVYQNGEKSTTVRMPNIVLKGLSLLFGGGDVAGEDMGMGFIDALSQTGGFVYIKDCRADSETWVYEQ
ncbi:MAG: hypothetical protein ACP5JH_10195 [Bacteroidota bacterium]